MKCDKCNKEQLYKRIHNGIDICNFCGEALPKPEKKPSFPYIPMDSEGHSRQLNKD